MSQPLVLHANQDGKDTAQCDCDCACAQTITPNTAAVEQFDAEALLPCPFCGGEAELRSGGTWRWVHCLTCGADGPTDIHKSVAVAGWNKRAQ